MKKIIYLLLFLFLSQTIFSQTQVGQTIFGEETLNSCGTEIALSADGTRMVVGFLGFSSAQAFLDSGFVRVYELNNNIWEQIGTDLEGEIIDKGTGMSVSISAEGNRIAYGAPYTRAENISGIVRVMEYDGNDWIQLGSKLSSDDLTNAWPNFGVTISLSLDGNTIAVGAPTMLSYTGKVYTYKYIDGEWDLIGELTGSETFQTYSSGVKISKNGKRLPVSDGDLVTVYDFIEEAWIPIGNTIIETNNFSPAIDMNLDGSRLVVTNPNFFGPKGFVKVYELSDTTWIQIGENIEPSITSGYFGYSTSLSADGNTIIIGAPNNNGGGEASVHKYDGENWVPFGDLIFGDSGDDCGKKVFISQDGSKIGVGSPSYDQIEDFGGLTRVFKINENTSSFETIFTCEPYQVPGIPNLSCCLLYTSDAADE